MLITINKLLPSPSLASTLPPRQAPSLGPPGKRESSHLVLPRPHRLLPKLPTVQLVQKKHFSSPRKHKPTWFPQDSVDQLPQDSVDQLPFSAKDHRLDPSPTLP